MELQGIHSVRWLSRGLAVQRLADNLPASVILLYENDPKAYLLVTSLKFHFLLFFLADVDVTHVLQMVDNTRLTLRNRYLSDADDFGEGSNELSAFLAKHASSEKRVVKVTGTDSTGAPTTHEYTLHEQKIKGQKSGGGLDDCITLAKGYVKELLKRLESRMKDLGSLEGAKLFTQGAYPKSHSKRQRRFLQWLEALRNLFKRKPTDPDTLPGAERRRPAKDVVMVHAQRPVKRTKKTLAMLAAKQAAATAAADAVAREAAAAEEAARLEEELGPWQRRAGHGKVHMASDSELDGDDEEDYSHDSDSES
ncbi:unnamed protein product [Closterium sp. Naga37s-1]|nr:unnamed protein product [Closterium sp. Naga37s-1]CAI5524621.1 unnamed protein product [Closterium sp. Naga37s-1]